MRLRRKVIFPAALVLLAALTAFAALRGQSEGRRSQPRAEQQADDHHFPVADFRRNDATEQGDSKRRAKGKRYEDGGVAEDGAGLQEVVRSNNWEFEVAELPTAMSDVIIVGTIRDAQAHLSPGARGVYSEFTVAVDEVLKDPAACAPAGSLVAVDREGGRVRYPSGKIVTYAVAGQDMPRVNRQYVLFLKREGGNLSILTGYELQGGKVRPLDRPRHFKRFEGAGRETLIGEIRNSLAPPSATPGGEGS